ncbi:MAG TPA: Ig-like domain-containing protein [Labilithrix sp.]|nr:Ig-like domain-containing protein [Labilithrix sp.]
MSGLPRLAVVTALLLVSGCGESEGNPIPEEPDAPVSGTVSRPSVQRRSAPSLEPLEVPDWPPFGPESRIEASCSSEVDLSSISAQFRRASSAPAHGKGHSTSFSGSELGEGKGPLSIRCCNASGACVEREITDFLVDLTAPQIEGERLVASPLLDGFDGDISVWVRDAWILGSVELSFGGKTLRHEFPKAYPSTVGKEWDISRVSFPAKDLPSGTGKALVTVRDAAGNTAFEELELRIDSTLPTVSILEPAPATVVTGPTFVVKVRAMDPDNPTPAQVDLWIGGARVAELAGPTAELIVDASTFPPGPAEIRAVARDDAGNESTTAKVVVQISAPP